MNFYIYKHTNKINGKIYIGQTCQKPKYRWGKNGNGYKNSPHFYAAIQKYGWDNFKHEILYSELTEQKANELEQKLIEQTKSNDPKIGYNSENGGRNKIPNESTRQRQQQSAMNRPIVSDETKRKLSEIGKGRLRSEEIRKKIKEAATKREQERNGKKQAPVVCENTSQLFLSCREAANWCGLVGVSGISSVCRKGK